MRRPATVMDKSFLSYAVKEQEPFLHLHRAPRKSKTQKVSRKGMTSPSHSAITRKQMSALAAEIDAQTIHEPKFGELEPERV